MVVEQLLAPAARPPARRSIRQPFVRSCEFILQRMTKR